MTLPQAHNMAIGIPEWSDAATLTASLERSGFPVTKLQTMDPTDRFEADDVSDIISLSMDRGEIATHSLIGMLHNNASPTGTFRYRAGNSLPLTGTSIDTDRLGPFVRLSDAAGSYGLVAVTGYSGSDFNFEAWISPSHKYAHGILYSGTSGGASGVVLRTNVYGQLVATDLPSEASTLTGTYRLQADTLYHVAVDYDDGTGIGSIFLHDADGNLLESVSGSVSGWAVGPAFIGGPDQVNRFTGRQNDYRLWNISRSAATVASEMFDLLAGTESGLIGNWPILNSDVPTTQAANSVGGGNPMVFSGSITFGFNTPLWIDEEHLEWRNGILHLYPIGVSARYVQIDILDQENEDGIYRQGRLYLSNALQLIGPLNGSDLSSWNDPSLEQRTRLGGVSYIRTRNLRNSVMRFMTDDDYTANWLDHIIAARGGSADVLLVPIPNSSYGSQRSPMYGMLSKRSRIEHTAYGYFRGQLEMREL